MSDLLQLDVEVSGERLDRYLAQRCALSRSQIQRLIQEGSVSVNGRTAKAGLKLASGDQVAALLTVPPSPALVPEDIPLAVVYEDEDLLVIDKPAGLPVHPAPGHSHHTLVNAVLAHCPELAVEEGSLRPGIVHRLDKDTSGLMMVAKHQRAQLHLEQQLRERTVTKGYLALVEGKVSAERGLIDAPLGRDPRHRQRIAVLAGGREARTHFRVMRPVGDYTLLEIRPETGRTHQIRVHLAAIGHPVVGDGVYGRKRGLLARQFLHAHLLGFRLPSNGQYQEFTAALPPDLQETLSHLSGAPLDSDTVVLRQHTVSYPLQGPN